MVFRKRTAVLLLIICGLFLYLNTARNQFILGDDEDQIVNNPRVRSIQSIPGFFNESTYYSQETGQTTGLFYRPVMMSLYTVLYSAAGPNPAVFHLFQLLLHVGNALIVFLILILFFPNLLAFLFAAIFLVHPINSETVLYAANLQDVLYFFFGGLAFLSVVHRRSLFIIGVFLICALFSKETAVVFGLISAGYVYLFDKKRLKSVGIVVGGVTLIYLCLRFFVLHIGLGQRAISPIAELSLPLRLLNIPSIVLKYLQTFLFPIRLEAWQYDVVTQADLRNVILPAVILAVIGTMCVLRIRHRKSTYIFFGSWFILGLLPHLHIMPLAVTVAERWFYLPIVGLLGLIATFLTDRFTKKIQVILIVVIVLLAARTYIRVGDWHDSETLFLRELTTNPHNYFVQNNLGNVYMNDGDYAKAKPYVEDSVQIYPYLANLNNLAVIYAYEEDIPNARKYFELALDNATSFEVYKNYANFLLYIAKDYDQAISVAEEGIRRYPAAVQLKHIKEEAEKLD